MGVSQVLIDLLFHYDSFFALPHLKPDGRGAYWDLVTVPTACESRACAAQAYEARKALSRTPSDAGPVALGSFWFCP